MNCVMYKVVNCEVWQMKGCYVSSIERDYKQDTNHSRVVRMNIPVQDDVWHRCGEGQDSPKTSAKCYNRHCWLSMQRGRMMVLDANPCHINVVGRQWP